MNTLLIIFVAAVALVIFICVRQALLVSPFADNSLVMSIAVTALCLLGMFRHVGGFSSEPVTAEPGGEGLTSIVLLPYAALGISIVFVFLLAALARIVNSASKRLHKGKKCSDQRTQDHLVDDLDDSSLSRRHAKKSRSSSVRKR